MKLPSFDELARGQYPDVGACRFVVHFNTADEPAVQLERLRSVVGELSSLRGVGQPEQAYPRSVLRYRLSIFAFTVDGGVYFPAYDRLQRVHGVVDVHTACGAIVEPESGCDGHPEVRDARCDECYRGMSCACTDENTPCVYCELRFGDAEDQGIWGYSL